MSDNDRLSAKQLRAIEALLREPTTRAAALAAQVSEATLWRWLNEQAFQLAYRQARAQLLESTLTALQSAGSVAVETLRAVMKDTTAQASARVSAAKAVLELGLKGRELLDTEARLVALEERFAASQPQGVRLK